jgi:hypothetical protein
MKPDEEARASAQMWLQYEEVVNQVRRAVGVPE